MRKSGGRPCGFAPLGDASAEEARAHDANTRTSVGLRIATASHRDRQSPPESGRPVAHGELIPLCPRIGMTKPDSTWRPEAAHPRRVAQAGRLKGRGRVRHPATLTKQHRDIEHHRTQVTNDRGIQFCVQNEGVPMLSTSKGRIRLRRRRKHPVMLAVRQRPQV